MNGPWIQTYTGNAFPLLEPKPEDVKLLDIAHALSNLCRFTGHTRRFYSVAQHSVLVSYVVPRKWQMQALLHDAPEAYIGDLNRPTKHAVGLEVYREIEQRIWLAVAAHFEVPAELAPEVKHADNQLLFTERRDLMGEEVMPWADAVEPCEFHVLPFEPAKARQLFLTRYWDLRGCSSVEGARLAALLREE